MNSAVVTCVRRVCHEFSDLGSELSHDCSAAAVKPKSFICVYTRWRVGQKHVNNRDPALA